MDEKEREELQAAFVLATEEVAGVWGFASVKLLAFAAGALSHSAVYGHHKQVKELLGELFACCNRAHEPILKSFEEDSSSEEAAEEFTAAVEAMSKLIIRDVGFPQQCAGKCLLGGVVHIMADTLQELTSLYQKLLAHLRAGFGGDHKSEVESRAQFVGVMRRAWQRLNLDATHILMQDICDDRRTLSKHIEDRFIYWSAEGLSTDDAFEHSMIDGSKSRHGILHCDLDCLPPGC